MYVYVITNTVNDKAYVGQTVQKPSWRWSHHLADARKGKKLSAPKQREIRSQLSLQQWAKRKAANE